MEKIIKKNNFLIDLILETDYCTETHWMVFKTKDNIYGLEYTLYGDDQPNDFVDDSYPITKEIRIEYYKNILNREVSILDIEDVGFAYHVKIKENLTEDELNDYLLLKGEYFEYYKINYGNISNWKQLNGLKILDKKEIEFFEALVLETLKRMEEKEIENEVKEIKKVLRLGTTLTLNDLRNELNCIKFLKSFNINEILENKNIEFNFKGRIYIKIGFDIISYNEKDIYETKIEIYQLKMLRKEEI